MNIKEMARKAREFLKRKQKEGEVRFGDPTRKKATINQAMRRAHKLRRKSFGNFKPIMPLGSRLDIARMFEEKEDES